MQPDLTRSEKEEEKITKINFDSVSKDVVDIAFNIHQTMGVGLLECIYEDCFAIELKNRNIEFERQKKINVYYQGQKIPSFFKLDFVIEGTLIVELKSVEKIISAHTAQILTYMKMAEIKSGLLINFGDPYFKNGIKRFIL